MERAAVQTLRGPFARRRATDGNSSGRPLGHISRPDGAHAAVPRLVGALRASSDATRRPDLVGTEKPAMAGFRGAVGRPQDELKPLHGAEGGTRTPTLLKAADFESAASTDSATSARGGSIAEDERCSGAARPFRERASVLSGFPRRRVGRPAGGSPGVGGSRLCDAFESAPTGRPWPHLKAAAVRRAASNPCKPALSAAAPDLPRNGCGCGCG